MKRARGIDISKWQIYFNFKDNLDFVIIKASEGLYPDPKFDELAGHASDVPLRGAYHYYRTSEDPIAQADYFLDMVADKGFHFLAVDYETTGNDLDKQGAFNLLRMLKHLRRVQDLPVLIYTSPYCYRDNVTLWDEAFDTFPLWVARWKFSDADVADPTAGILDRSWDLWQWSSDGCGAMFGVGSERVDLDVYNGSVEQMQEWLNPIEETEMKKWYQSRTLWFSILFALVNVAGIFGFAEFVPGDEIVQYVNIGVSVIVALLRVFTNQALEL